MSKIKITRFDVYGSAEYSAKGSLVLYDHHKKVVEDLERQLEEAREFSKYVLKMNGCGYSYEEMFNEWKELYSERLKERNID